ncbi:uncharacterized protein K02A2.6-like [Ornithodoros turicata]|uniref:uncharacterized protein K02A2.6-like n=1 Tax=Ornithodoros turicata TaxID=34597 RepID=UPI003139327D
MDLFFVRGRWRLIVTDCFSRYPDIACLENLSSACVVNHCKPIFSRHGIPEVVVSDNGPQFSKTGTSSLASFAKEYQFIHVTASSRYPQSNRVAEAAVKVIKQSITKTGDPYKSLLSYRTLPLKNGYSPAQLLMWRQLRTTVPADTQQLVPSLPNYNALRQFEQQYRQRQKRDYNRRQGVRDPPELQEVGGRMGYRLASPGHRHRESPRTRFL